MISNKTAALGIGVPAGEQKPCSGILFSFQCKDGYIWGGNFPSRAAAEIKKTEFFDKRKAEFIAMNEDAHLYDVTIIEVPSTEPDAIQTSWGEMVWTGEFDEKGVKLYKLDAEVGQFKASAK